MQVNGGYLVLSDGTKFQLVKVPSDSGSPGTEPSFAPVPEKKPDDLNKTDTPELTLPSIEMILKMSPEGFGAQLRRERGLAGLNQSQLAELSGLYSSYEQICRIETGRNKKGPSVKRRTILIQAVRRVIRSR